MYVTDTVSLVRAFSGSGVIGKKAKKIFNDADQGLNHIIIPILVFVEIMYLSRKNRLAIDFDAVIKKVT